MWNCILKTLYALHDFLLNPNRIDILWEGSYLYDYERSFNNFNAADILNLIYKLYCKCSDLCSIDLSSIRINDILKCDNYKTENNKDYSVDKSENKAAPTFIETNFILKVKSLLLEYFRSKSVDYFSIFLIKESKN